MSSPFPLWLAAQIVRRAAVLVPGTARAEWIREWEAELQHLARRAQRSNQGWKAQMTPIWRALGALPDAVAVQSNLPSARAVIPCEGLVDASLLRRPTAVVPVGMSLAALAIVIGYAALFGTARQADEGTAAHLWQLLMAGQLPVIGLFAIKWLRADPKNAMIVLVVQIGAAVAAMFPVWWFQW